MTEREELIEELKSVMIADSYTLGSVLFPKNIAYVADFILADRRRVVEPLVRLNERIDKISNIRIIDDYEEANLSRNAIDQTLANAGITNKEGYEKTK